MVLVYSHTSATTTATATPPLSHTLMKKREKKIWSVIWGRKPKRSSGVSFSLVKEKRGGAWYGSRRCCGAGKCSDVFWSICCAFRADETPGRRFFSFLLWVGVRLCWFASPLIPFYQCDSSVSTSISTNSCVSVSLLFILISSESVFIIRGPKRRMGSDRDGFIAKPCLPWLLVCLPFISALLKLPMNWLSESLS